MIDALVECIDSIMIGDGVAVKCRKGDEKRGSREWVRER